MKDKQLMTVVDSICDAIRETLPKLVSVEVEKQLAKQRNPEFAEMKDADERRRLGISPGATATTGRAPALAEMKMMAKRQRDEMIARGVDLDSLHGSSRPAKAVSTAVAVKQQAARAVIDRIKRGAYERK